MRRVVVLLIVLLASSCGGGDEPSAVPSGDCPAAWNGDGNPHRRSVPESMGAAHVSAGHGRCSYLFHDWGRYVRFEGDWMDWDGTQVSRGALTRDLQRTALDNYTVEPDGRLRSLAAASRGWGRRWCRLVGENGGLTYELCREPAGPGPQRIWRNPGAFVVDGEGVRRLLHVKLPSRGSGQTPVVGHWEWAALAPDGKTLLAHWSAECEVPIAYLVGAAGGGLPREALPGAHSSFALGWSGDRAVVARRGSCGDAADARLELVGDAGVQPTRITISHRILWDVRELVDAAGGNLGAVLRRCGIVLEARRPQTIRLAACR